MKNPQTLFGLAVIAFSALTGSVIADDLVKMTIGQRGNWDTVSAKRLASSRNTVLNSR
jgi:hypothetical protein